MKDQKHPSLVPHGTDPGTTANPWNVPAAASATRRGLLLCAGISALASVAVHAAPLLTPGDPVFAYDLDTAAVSTGGINFPAVSYPAGEPPANAIDGNSGSKYLNYGKYGAGIIVTPGTAAVAKSLVLNTANDATERDPASYIIFGSNLPITSADNSNGFADNWTFIGQGTLSLPTARQTAATPVNLTNTTSYSSYWIVFPSLRNTGTANSMQIGEIQLFTGLNGTGTAIFAPGNTTRSTGWNSSVANGEFVARVIDGNPSTKYLNFGENNSGFFVVPSTGPSIVTSFQLSTANDANDRDPASWELHGMAPSGQWSLIESGTVALPTTRNTPGPVVPVTNSSTYVAYRMTFPTVRNATSANSMQVAEAQFFGTVVPAKDTDGDLMDDDWETLYGLTVGVNDSADDSLDNDGSPNIEEYQRGTNPTNPDTDGDDLEDGVESDTGDFEDESDTGSDPLDADSDDDTYPDGYEVEKGTDPNAAGAVPTITWDTLPGTAGPGDGFITGATGTWDNLTTANWTTDGGVNNVTWDNAGQRLAAIFGGTSGTVTLTGPVAADRVIVNSDGYLFDGASLTLGSLAPVINITAGTTEMSQVLAGTAGFTKQGNGTLRLTGASNTYSGTTSLKGLGKIILAKDPGEIAIPGNLFLDNSAFAANTSGLVLAGDEQIADTSIVTWANVGQGDTYFRLNGYTETVGGLVSDGVGGFVVIENRGFGDTVEYPSGELIVHTTGSNSYFYNGQIRNIDGGTSTSTVSITKSGTGTQILAGGNMSYSGTTTVLGGTLQLNGNLPNSLVVVETGGTLAGTTTVTPGISVFAGGTVSPGTTGTGTITAGTTVINGTYVCQIDGANADRLTVNGDLDVTGGTLQLSVLNPPTAASYVLVSHTGVMTDAFTVTGVPDGYEISYDGTQLVLAQIGFPAWANFYGLTGVDTDDFDKDGLPDAVEYVLGTNPTVANHDGPAGAVDGENFTFTFVRDHASMTPDITLAIEVSTDLGTWEEEYLVGDDTGSSTPGVTVTDNGSSDTVLLTVPRAPDGAKFARLRVTVAAP